MTGDAMRVLPALLIQESMGQFVDHHTVEELLNRDSRKRVIGFDEIRVDIWRGCFQRRFGWLVSPEAGSDVMNEAIDDLQRDLGQLRQMASRQSRGGLGGQNADPFRKVTVACIDREHRSRTGHHFRRQSARIGGQQRKRNAGPGSDARRRSRPSSLGPVLFRGLSPIRHR